jgi:hypothetical protein
MMDCILEPMAHRKVPEGNCFPVASCLGTAVVCLLGDSSQQQNDDFLLKDRN